MSFLKTIAGLTALEADGKKRQEIEDEQQRSQKAEDLTRKYKYDADVAEGQAHSHRILNEGLEDEVGRLKRMFGWSFDDIANQFYVFKVTLNQWKMDIAGWQLARHAWKETVVKYGAQLGKTEEEIMNDYRANRMSVLTSQAQIDNEVQKSVYLKNFREQLLAEERKNRC